jgi:peptide/nickel transport system substrate-binding protein
VSPGSQPTPSGTLRIAIPDRPDSLDPLLATSAADRLVVGQIYEPLTRAVSGPYGEGVSQPGLALWARAGAGGTIWRIRLRPGVRFSDGAHLNAAAILQNAMRWRTTAEGQALLPGLVAADAPAPDLVRFIFDRPVADLVHRLASVRLGVVSPRALRSPDAGSRLAHGLAAGTGPFELHRADSREILLARNARLAALELALRRAVAELHRPGEGDPTSGRARRAEPECQQRDRRRRDPHSCSSRQCHPAAEA